MSNYTCISNIKIFTQSSCQQMYLNPNLPLYFSGKETGKN